MLIAGNWKMNLMPHEGMLLTHEICQGIDDIASHVEVLICPPFTHITQCSLIIEHSESRILLGAQNCHDAQDGAFTGEISASMLASLGVDYVILGHSERRTLCGETNELVARKCLRALQSGLIPIVCVGETLDERNDGNVGEIITSQLRPILQNEDIIQSIAKGSIVFAYEPVWAIGTGLAATPQQAEEIHALIRTNLQHALGEDSSMIDIIYGGSVKPENASDFFSQPNIDGALIGGASLKAASFLSIAKQA
ncbi:MAG: triose-phosphate isomerase [Bacteroidota bacterium]